MPDALDGRLLKLNKSLRNRNKKNKGRPPGPLYDWVESVLADKYDDDPQAHIRVQMDVKKAMLLVKANLKTLKNTSVSDIKDDILRILVLYLYNLSTGEFLTSASEYLMKCLVLTSCRSLKPLLYTSMAVIGAKIPLEIEHKFYNTVFQDIDECNIHTLRWVANFMMRIPPPVVERMISSLQNLLFRSVAPVSVLEKAAAGLLNLSRHHGGMFSLGSEIGRWVHESLL
jgi:hypothetical protein